MKEGSEEAFSWFKSKERDGGGVKQIVETDGFQAARWRNVVIA